MNNLTVMAVSGATKGGNDTITQMAGMRGLVGDPTGRLVPMPIQSNLREGMDALEYFISIHGSRKGLADTALRTAEAGYLTRRLVDIAQDVIINSEDCGSKDGIYIYAIEKGVARERPFRERLRGRVTAERVINPDTGEVVAERDTYISKELARIIGETSNEKVKVRSALTCELVNGICAKCYGEDLGRGTMVELGGAVESLRLNQLVNQERNLRCARFTPVVLLVHLILPVVCLVLKSFLKLDQNLKVRRS